MDSSRRRGTSTLIAVLGGLALPAAAVALLQLERYALAGGATLLAGMAIHWARWVAQRDAASGGHLVANLAERIADAAVLGSVAWVAAPSSPGVAAAALAALGMAYVAWYTGAKAAGLGFGVRDGSAWEALHFALVGLGLVLTGSSFGAALLVALWLAAGVSGVDLVRSAATVARQEERP